MRVLTIGGATLDIFFTDDKQHIKRLSRDQESQLLVPEGAKLIMEDAHLASGGGATNAAAAIQQLNINTDVCCTIGTDCIAEWVRDDLCHRSIGCEYLRTTDKEHTAISSIIPSPSGERTIFVYRGANAHFTPDHMPDQHTLSEYDGTYITSLGGKAATHIPDVTQSLHDAGVPLIAHNPGSEELTEYTDRLYEALAHIDILITNAREARELLAYISDDPACVQQLLETPFSKEKSDMPELLTNFDTIQDTCIDIRTYMREIIRRGPHTVVVTNGSEGAYVANNDTLYFGAAPEVNVQCSVGAGDAFGSTFFANRLINASIKQAIARGMENSCNVLQSTDAKTKLQSQSDLADVTTDHIQQYSLHDT